jgi:hypothetical protein
MSLEGRHGPRGAISSGEWRFVAVLVATLLLLTALPYAFGYASAPPDRQFMGLVFNVSDHTQYFSWYREFQQGFLAENRLTPEPNEPVFFNLLWWSLGKFGLITGLEVAQVYQAFRLFAGAVFICAVYLFCALFFKDVWKRKIATLVITCGSGLGWVLVVLKYTLARGELLFPLDVYRAGTNSFLSIMAFPHFVMANSLIVITLALVLRAHERRQLGYSVAAGFVALVLGWQHAYDLITVYAVILAYAVLESIRLKRIAWHLVWSGLIVGLLSCSAAVYSVYITSAYPIWEAVLAQFDNAGVFTADPFHVLILVGLPLIVAVLTFDGLVPLRRRHRRELFVKTWFLVSFVVGYLPVVYQVHLTNCWQVPVGILATAGLFRHVIPYLQLQGRRWIARLSPDRFQRLASLLFVLAVLPTSVYLLAWRVYDLNRHEYPYFLYQDDLDALAWLRENTVPSDVVLSARTVGQYIPAVAGNKAFLAHWAQTVGFFEKIEMVESFFARETDDAYRLALVEEFDVRYVLYGRTERDLGDFDPAAVPYLVEVFSGSATRVFRVLSGGTLP